MHPGMTEREDTQRGPDQAEQDEWDEAAQDDLDVLPESETEREAEVNEADRQEQEQLWRKTTDRERPDIGLEVPEADAIEQAEPWK